MAEAAGFGFSTPRQAERSGWRPHPSASSQGLATKMLLSAPTWTKPNVLRMQVCVHRRPWTGEAAKTHGVGCCPGLCGGRPPKPDKNNECFSDRPTHDDARLPDRTGTIAWAMVGRAHRNGRPTLPRALRY